MAIGRGFVRSGSGYVSTPTTRAAARAAGTFGGEGFAGAESAASKMLALFKKQTSQYGDVKALRLQRERAGKAAATLAKTELARCTAKCFRLYPSNPARVAICTAQCVTGQKPSVTPPETPPITPPPTPGVAICPRGLRYTKLTRWGTCDAGYISTKGSGLSILGADIYPYMPGNECVCIASEAGKAIVEYESEPRPTDVPGDETVNGDGVGLGDIVKTGDYIPIIIGGAIVVAILGLFKK